MQSRWLISKIEIYFHIYIRYEIQIQNEKENEVINDDINSQQDLLICAQGYGWPYPANDDRNKICETMRACMHTELTIMNVMRTDVDKLGILCGISHYHLIIRYRLCESGKIVDYSFSEFSVYFYSIFVFFSFRMMQKMKFFSMASTIAHDFLSLNCEKRLRIGFRASSESTMYVYTTLNKISLTIACRFT